MAQPWHWKLCAIIEKYLIAVNALWNLEDVRAAPAHPHLQKSVIQRNLNKLFKTVIVREPWAGRLKFKSVLKSAHNQQYKIGYNQAKDDVL